ncbi:DNA-directed RNA polymerase subunit alpha C-terminal domain-containing protein [Paenarthrobacter sp. NPDC089675]|uniref:DNA-directed RNA polymerase subunit alpha C-terminal domain-containing protein n=1 Tax=Paenarthrobacter sp. NPDC089675 TaxID=3364376 RepID=UPI0038189E66
MRERASVTGGPAAGTPIISLGLPSRATNALARHGIRTVEVLATWSRAELQGQIIGLGSSSVDLIEAAVRTTGRQLAVADPGKPYQLARVSTNQRHIANHHAWVLSSVSPATTLGERLDRADQA